VVLGVKLDKGDDLSAVLDQFEVLIDFTRPEATLDYLAICLSANKAMANLTPNTTPSVCSIASIRACPIRPDAPVTAIFIIGFLF
jgi:dihydrodipicolinate reductase